MAAVRGSARARNWMVTATLNTERKRGVTDEVYLERVVEAIDIDDLRFVQFQREQGEGENGYIHLQGMVCFARKKRLSSVVNMHMFGVSVNVHCMIMRGTLQQAAAYTSKDETRIGLVTHSHGKRGSTDG